MPFYNETGGMHMSMLFFDVDGTIVCEDGTIPKSTTEAIRALQKQGHRCIINTGRPLADIYSPLSDIPWDGYICACGQDIFWEGQHIFRQGFEPAVCEKIIEMAKKCRGGLYYESPNGVAIDNWFDIRNSEIDAAVQRFNGRGIPVRSLAQSPELRMEKFCFFYDESSDEKAFLDFIRPYCTVIKRDPSFYELPPAGCSKASGIQFLCELSHISPQDCYAFGDSQNDVAMLRCLGHPVVMQHAPEDVRQLAEWVAPSPQHDGIYLAVQKFGLLSAQT